MSLIDAFKFKTCGSLNANLPVIYPMNLKYEFFVNSDLITIYSKILTDCIERIQGIPEKFQSSLWDNCLENEAKKGLITLLAEAMVEKRELYLIYNKGVNVLRKATQNESQQIKLDYEQKGESALGIYVSFEQYSRTDMLKFYSGMEYSVLNSLNKTVNLAAAIQFKMSKMRESVGAVDSATIITQAGSIAHALKEGHDVVIDGEDKIETSKPEMESTKQAIAFLDAKRSFYLNMPLSYINGEQTPGIGSTGEADTKATERGLKHYFVSILKPIFKALFGVETSFKSNDFRQITAALDAIQTFELVGVDLISKENKQLIVKKLLDLES
jgi:hypothetical protein